jgi:hypothetical protein
VSFTGITICVASQQAFIVVAYLFIDSIRKLLDTPQVRVMVYQYGPNLNLIEIF